MRDHENNNKFVQVDHIGVSENATLVRVVGSVKAALSGTDTRTVLGGVLRESVVRLASTGLVTSTLSSEALAGIRRDGQSTIQTSLFGGVLLALD